MTQAIRISNNFDIPDHIRHVVTPNGNLFVMGGFNPFTQTFLSETYLLDEYQEMLKPLGDMFQARADHVVHYHKDNIYVFGGMSYREEAAGGKPYVQSLNTAEFFSISSKKWIAMPNFEFAR